MLLLSAMLILSCGGDDSGTNSGNGSTPVQSSIGPEGGTIEMTGKASLTVPAGALSDTVDFSIEINGSPDPPGGSMGFVSSAYTIEPTGTQFSTPAVVRINYNEQDLGGGDEDSVKIYTNDGSAWDPLSTTVNEVTNQATTEVTHLSDFAVMVDTTSSVSEGVFAALAVGRSIMVFEKSPKSIPSRMDVIVARFDSTYAPCSPITPLQANSVTCNEYTLTWQSVSNLYSYSDCMNPEFIDLGEKYRFNVVGGGAVPSLVDSIDFPTLEPYITDPSMNAILSLSGFSVTWTGTGDGEVYLILVEESGQGDSSLFIQTPNNGSYTFSAAQLSGLAAGEYGMVMVYENWDYINVAGFDSRSFIRARVINTTLIVLQ